MGSGQFASLCTHGTRKLSKTVPLLEQGWGQQMAPALPPSNPSLQAGLSRKPQATEEVTQGLSQKFASLRVSGLDIFHFSGHSPFPMKGKSSFSLPSLSPRTRREGSRSEWKSYICPLGCMKSRIPQGHLHASDIKSPEKKKQKNLCMSQFPKALNWTITVLALKLKRFNLENVQSQTLLGIILELHSLWWWQCSTSAAVPKL